jgi:hypothetical protein
MIRLAGMIGAEAVNLVRHPMRLRRLGDPHRIRRWLARIGLQAQLAPLAWTEGRQIAQRRYATYEQYVAHQTAKLETQDLTT